MSCFRQKVQSLIVVSLATLFVITIACATGCQRVPSSQSWSLARPFNLAPTSRWSNPFVSKGSASNAGTAPLGPLPSERTMCIETARTVAKDGHLREAIALYERAEKIEPTAPALDAELAPLYALSGHFERSISRYRRAIEAQPANSELRNNLAWTLMEAERLDEAVREVDSAVAEFPRDQRLQSTRAVLLHRSGNKQAAWEQFRALYGESAAHHNLALLEFESGDDSTAQVHLASAMSDRPGEATQELKAAMDATLQR